MKDKLIYGILFLSLLPFFHLTLKAQEPAKITPYVTLQYFKNTDGQRILQTTLTYSQNRMELPLPGMEISFHNGTDQKVLLAKSVTDGKGIARFELGSEIKLKTDAEGMWPFSSEFMGNDTIEGGTSEVTVRDLRLEMSLSEADSIKTITVNAFASVGGKDKPVSGETVTIYVPRMFSLLPVGEITLDDAGTGSLDFPSDLPGDKTGSLLILAKIEGNDTYGNVEKRETIQWGTPTDYSVPVTHRALWTKIAPRWMIYTLSVLLAGVWGHYLYAIISLIRIKINADRKKAMEEFRL
jgi:hypothetical protein